MLLTMKVQIVFKIAIRDSFFCIIVFLNFCAVEPGDRQLTVHRAEAVN